MARRHNIMFAALRAGGMTALSACGVPLRINGEARRGGAEIGGDGNSRRRRRRAAAAAAGRRAGGGR